MSQAEGSGGMNSLQYLKTDSDGNSVFLFGFDGYEWVFKQVSRTEVVLEDVAPVGEFVSSGRHSVFMGVDEIPRRVTRAVDREGYSVRERVASIEGAMGGPNGT